MPVKAPAYAPYNWTGFYIGINGGGGWDHPIHIHFEEGQILERDGADVPCGLRGRRLRGARGARGEEGEQEVPGHGKPFNNRGNGAHCSEAAPACP